MEPTSDPHGQKLQTEPSPRRRESPGFIGFERGLAVIACIRPLRGVPWEHMFAFTHRTKEKYQRQAAQSQVNLGAVSRFDRENQSAVEHPHRRPLNRTTPKHPRRPGQPPRRLQTCLCPVK